MLEQSIPISQLAVVLKVQFLFLLHIFAVVLKVAHTLRNGVLLHVFLLYSGLRGLWNMGVICTSFLSVGYAKQVWISERMHSINTSVFVVVACVPHYIDNRSSYFRNPQNNAGNVGINTFNIFGLPRSEIRLSPKIGNSFVDTFINSGSFSFKKL